MSSERQTRGGQELDQWLTTAMASLHAALDDVLDLDAGLADAQLPGLQNALVHNLDDILDLDTGLSHIMHTPPPTSDATRPADQIRRYSVEVESGQYEIHPGTASGIDTTANAPGRNDHVTLRSAAVFDLLAPRTPAVPVKVELRYDTRDPYAVVAAFRTGRAGWVEWVFARDLLADGLIAEAGNGDVRIRPAVDDPEEVVVIELSAPSGHAVFEASAQELADFLDRTYDVVVPGNEYLWVNVDEALTHLSSTDLT